MKLKCTQTFKDRVLEIEKSYRIVGSLKKLIVDYIITNLSDDIIDSYFVSELNFILPGNDKNNVIAVNNSDNHDYDQKELYSFDNVSSLRLLNTELQHGIQCNFLSVLAPVEMFTILSHEFSESLEYTNYQGHCLLPIIEMHLEPLGNQKISIELELL